MKITANGIDVHYRVEGEGPWITLSHSLACDLDMWEEQARILSRNYEIKCPTLVIVGEQDQGTPPAMARQIHENLRGSELQIIPSAAHLSNVEQAQVFTEAVLGFSSASAAASRASWPAGGA